MDIAPTDENAIRFLVGLSGVLIIVGLARVVLPNVTDALMLGMGLSIAAIFAGMAAPTFYEMTMKDSLSVLKLSLLIALLASLAGAISGGIAGPVVATVFILSPSLYDFMRDVVFPNVPRTIPWHERELSTRLLEIIVEATIGALISLLVVYTLTGHM